MNYLINLWNALDFGSMGEMLQRLLSVLLCLTVHEICHGVAAYALGDPTAKSRNRLSLNPLRHIDWLGFAMLMFAGFGWAKPVPVDPRYFKNPKRGMALTALAGPVSNFLLALFLLGILSVAFSAGYAMPGVVQLFLVDTAIRSIGLGVFNLIPIPPLDGSKVVACVLPDDAYRALMRYERYGIVVLWVLVAAGIGGGWINGAVSFIFQLFCRIVGF